MTNRRNMLKGGLAGAALATTAASAQTPQAAAINWRMTSSYPKALDAVFGAGDIFIKAVSDMSGGRIQLQHFASGELVPGLQALDAVQNGTVECCDTASFYYVGKDPSFAFGAAVPFGLNTRQQNAWFFQGGGLALFNELLAQIQRHRPADRQHQRPDGRLVSQGNQDDRRSEGPQDPDRRAGRTGRREARRRAPADRRRATSTRRSNAAPSMRPNGSAPMTTRSSASARVAPYYYYPGWWEGSSAILLMINRAKWDELSATDKAIFTAAAHQAHTMTIAKYDDVNPAAIKRLIASGTQLRAFSPEIMDACAKAANELYEEIGAKNPMFKKLHDHMMAYRNEQLLWQQVAEFNYDAYQIRSRTRR